ncbi:YcxB family protein [Providencia sp. Je.9.19]|uniref:YcxB family protein n=1 Tax=Providencia sp. Je.9.19 TaxID=3142844 RepID=UPI003DA8C5E5
MKSRYDIRYSLASLETESILKLLKKNKIIWKLNFHKVLSWVGSIGIICALLSFIGFFFGALVYIMNADNIIGIGGDSSTAMRVYSMSLMALLFCALAFFLLGLKTAIEYALLKRKEEREQQNADAMRHMRITRYYISEVHKFGSIKFFWSYIESAYIAKGFMFIQTTSNEYFIFPSRVFSSEDEFQEVYEFVTEQIARHKSK